MDYGRLKTEYLKWLMDIAQVEPDGYDGYSRLCEAMQEQQFIAQLDMDENRCSECCALRRRFAESETGLRLNSNTEDTVDMLDILLPPTGTFMELLIVMAEKMNYETADSIHEADVGKWFAEMLHNCGLSEATNGRWEAHGGDSFDSYVFDIFGTIIDRAYGWDGLGGLFPIQWPRQDQRYTELIIQMNDYIEENYDIC